VVLASNAGYFRQRYGFAPTGEYTGQLDNAGERLTLVSALGDTLLSVRYNDKAPWPTEPDTLGYSLVAKDINPAGDANEPSYWRTSYAINGSPGADDLVSNAVDQNIQPNEWRLGPNYPNPFNPETKFQFAIPTAAKVKITILNLLGEEVDMLTNEWIAAGVHELRWRPQSLPSGIYFCRMESGSFRQIRKLMLLK